MDPCAPSPPATDPRSVAEQGHLWTAGAVAEHLGVNPAVGLSDTEALHRQRQLGANRLVEAAPRSWASRLLSPFQDFMILVLLAAAVLSGTLGELTDTVVIVLIVLLNAVISVVQEWQADRALEALRRMAASQATVRRSSRDSRVDAEQLVPGDVVLLEAGNQVPADLRLYDTAQLRIDESALTGESVTVEKHHRHLEAVGHALADRHNMAYRGTLVTHGRATGLVVATGPHTEIGRIAGLLHRTPDRQTPLQRRLAEFGRRLSWVVLAISALVLGLGLLRGESLVPMALTAISLAVAAIPEALPAVVTVLLALGARRLVEVQALVRKLPSVEALGSVTTICSDKTGTLTLNRMSVAEVQSAAPHAVLEAAALCNDGQVAPDRTWLGDPTETALLVHAQAQGIDIRDLRSAWPRTHECPFDADRKRMGTVHRGPDGTWRVVVKGAPETLWACCRAELADAGPGDAPVPLRTAHWQQMAHDMARRGLRVLALAERAGSPDDGQATTPDALERDLVLLGLVGLIDPPRPEAGAAVAECRTAGIRPVMITGDHPATALAIAGRLGIVAETAGQDGTAAVITGTQLAAMDDDTLRTQTQRVSVYARMDPAQKIRIVQALQAQGEVVAMTGDGVNDAPALKQADIGVAMGRGGTDVAREAASLVLLDDHFATIVAAVREGRRIFDNIRKFIRYAMTGNSGEIWVLFLAPLLGLPIPLLPLHILWVNLVTDGLPGLALAAEPAEPGVMQRPPRPPQESVFAHGLWQHTLWVGLLIGTLCLGVHAWAQHGGHPHGQTMVFTTLTLAQMAHLLGIRSETQPLWRLGLASNRPLLGAVALTVVMQLATVYLPALQPLFHTHPLSATELGVCVACALLVYGAVELEKIWRQTRGRR